MSYFGPYFGEDGGGGGPGPGPTIAVVSPTPDTAPGAPGGFPRTYAKAKDVEIVLDVSNVDPALGYFVVVARFYASSEDENPKEEVVYRRGQFRGLYIKNSRAEAIDNGVRLHTRRLGGWPSRDGGNSVAHVVFAVDALDVAGNIAP